MWRARELRGGGNVRIALSLSRAPALGSKGSWSLLLRGRQKCDSARIGG